MKFLNKIFSRVFIIGFIIFIQVVFLLFLMFEFQLAFRIVRVFFILITISQIVSIINSKILPTKWLGLFLWLLCLPLVVWYILLQVAKDPVDFCEKEWIKVKVILRSLNLIAVLLFMKLKSKTYV